MTDTPALTFRPHEDASNEVAAFEFLSSLLLVEKCRSTLLRADGFIRATLALAKYCPFFKLKSAAVHVAVAISPHAKQEQGKSLAFSPGDLMEVFRETLHLDKRKRILPTRSTSCRMLQWKVLKYCLTKSRLRFSAV